MKQILLGLIKIYQIVLAPYLGGRCRFTPSCSQYASQALEQFSIFFALTLIFKRLLRCHPWGGCGCDEVSSLGGK